MEPGKTIGALKKALKKAAKVLELFGDDRVIISLILILSFTIALALRIVPMKWGIYLNEFDPYYEYYLAETVLKKGNGDSIKGIFWWFSWWFDQKERDPLFWAPYGRDLRHSSQPGPAIFSVITYSILKSLGFNYSLYTVYAFIPPTGAALASIFIFFLAKELMDERAGVLASLFLSVSWAFIYRTNFGAKHEGLAIPLMILAFYFFLRAYRKHSLTYSVLAGIFLSGVVFSWGAYLYPWNMLALVALLWIILHPTDKTMALAYVPANLIASAAIAITPRFGPKVAFMSAGAILPLTATAISIFVLLGLTAIKLERERLRQITILVSILVAIVLGGLWYMGLLYSLPGRILAVAVPLWREVGVTTVAEHAIPTWAMLFSDYRALIIFSFAGVIALIGKKDLKSIFIIIFWFTALYFAMSMARLTLIFAPAVSIVAALGTTVVIDMLIRLSQEKPKLRRRKQSISRDIVVFSIILLIIALTPAVVSSPAILYSHQPPLIVTSSIPTLDYDYRWSDWLSALEWIRANVPQDATIATWWDYGYWISINTRRKTTCDNGTINSTQIRLIARAFLSNETEALKIFKELGVDYVVVYEPLQNAPIQALGLRVYFSLVYGGLGGDLAKSAQMARWIGWDPDKFTKVVFWETGGQKFPVLVPADTPEAKNATLYKMIFTKTAPGQIFIFEPIYMGRPVPGYDGPVYKLPQLEHFKLVYASEPNGWVKIFKVIYPENN